MEKKRTSLIFGLFGIPLLLLLFLCCRDYRRENQHRSVARYINSGQLLKTMAELGWTTNRLQDFSVSVQPAAVVIQVDARSKQEFNRLIVMANRPGRPGVEHVTVRFIETVSNRR